MLVVESTSTIGHFATVLLEMFKNFVPIIQIATHDSIVTEGVVRTGCSEGQSGIRTS